MIDRIDLETAEEHIFALEEFIEQIGPLLIATSPAKEQIVEILRSWSERETSDPVEVLQGNLADVLLRAIAEKAGT